LGLVRGDFARSRRPKKWLSAAFYAKKDSELAFASSESFFVG
jgi:hypothetical protein